MTLDLLIGSLAAILTTACYIPQVIRVLKHRRTKDLSLAMYIVLVIGLALWLAYGLMTWNMPIILANAVTLVLALIILVMKIRLG